MDIKWDKGKCYNEAKKYKIKKEFNYMHSDLPVDKVVPVKYVKGLDWILNRVEDYWKDNIDNLTPNQLVQAINEKVTELNIKNIIN